MASLSKKQRKRKRSNFSRQKNISILANSQEK